MKIYQNILYWYGLIMGRPILSKFNNFITLMGLRGLGVGNYEDDKITGEKWFLKSYLPSIKTPIIFDIGAHIGDTAKLIRSIKPDANIYSFEPNPRAYKILKKEGKKYNFKTYNLGMSDKPRNLTLYDNVDSCGSPFSSIYPGVINLDRRKTLKHQISLTTVDEFCHKNMPRKSIDLLKIDVEGHELAVIKGSTNILKKKLVPLILFEFNSMNIESRTFFTDYLKLLNNYQLYRLLPQGMIALSTKSILLNEIFVYQNIVAIRKS